MSVELEFPIEFLVSGTPVSLQTARADARDEWKRRVKDASRAAIPDDHWATDAPIAVTLFYFPPDVMQGDLDNIVKFILDALSQHLYRDDSQVQRIVVQKFEPDNLFSFTNPSITLAQAIESARPMLYVRLSIDPFEEFL